MRILAVTNMYPTSQNPSSGVFVEQQILGLRRIGLEVDVAFFDRIQQGVSAYLSLGRQLQLRVQSFQPDLVHSHYGGVMADLVTRTVQDVPVLVTFHGSDLLGGQTSAPVRRLLSGYGVRASRRAARRAQGVVTVSQKLCNALPQDVDRSKVRVIPNGIDLDRFRQLDRGRCCENLGWNPSEFNVLFANSGDPVKRPSLARAAVDILSRLGVPARMHEMRSIPNDQVPVWINSSSALLITSLYEGSPTIVKESLACGLPVVSVDVGDVRERLDGVEGCYIASPEPYDLAEKLRHVSSGRGRVDGRVKMEALSLTQSALRLEQFYSEVTRSTTSSAKNNVPAFDSECSETE